jgi:hypothetical protein
MAEQNDVRGQVKLRIYIVWASNGCNTLAASALGTGKPQNVVRRGILRGNAGLGKQRARQVVGIMGTFSSGGFQACPYPVAH